jgi:hypothetical protein
MRTLSRRHLLSGASAVLAMRALPALARARDADAALRTLLDRAAQGAPPDEILSQLAAIDATTLSSSAQLDLVTAGSGLAIDSELRRRFPFGRPGKGPYRVTPRAGAWIKHDDPRAIDADTAAILVDARAGVVLPADLLTRTIDAIQAARATAGDDVGPALDNQVSVLRGQLANAPAPGVGLLPQGLDYYGLLLRRFAGDDANPDTAWRRLEQERVRTLTRADALLKKLGQKTGTVGARVSALWIDPRWLYSDDDTGRDTAVADMNRTLDAARDRLPTEFADTPASAAAVRVRRMSPEDTAAGRSGYRVLPSATAPGSYFVDLKDIGRRPSWTLPGVVHHELLPGHMIQLPVEAAANPHPLRLEYAPAFAEGWAIYAEQLAATDGAFAGDQMAELGHLHWLLFRICRGLADLGIHLHGWTLEQTRAKLVEWQGEPAYFAPFAMELERTAAEPASRAAEALVWLTLADLAKGRDRKAFHSLVLADGRKRTDELRRIAAGAK